MFKRYLRSVCNIVKVTSSFEQLRFLFFKYSYKDSLSDGLRKNWFPIFIKYPVDPIPRYGYGKAPHSHLTKLFECEIEDIKKNIEKLKKYSPYLKSIPVKSDNPYQPYWDNPWFSNLDGVVLYGLIASQKPQRYIEIGSGFSTKFVRQAVQDHNLDTQIVSIDPKPRSEIDAISDIVIREPLENDNLELFEGIKPNEIIFLDGSHRCFMNSDVSVFFYLI